MSTSCGSAVIWKGRRRDTDPVARVDLHHLAAQRGTGIGRHLHGHVEGWLRGQGAQVLQVKTLAPAHPSPEYAETRQFYAAMGYQPLEVFPALWGPSLPVLQLIKVL